MEQLVAIIFILTTLWGVWFFKKIFKPDKTIRAILFIWLFIQGIVGLSGFYLNEMNIPPRFILLVLPPISLIIYLVIFKTKSETQFELKDLTLVHTIRIPVEISLMLLAVIGKVPKIMTFEGRNFDIIAGLTAFLIYYFTFKKPILDYKRLLIWNLLSLGLLINIVYLAVFSVKTPFQKYGFDVPNTAVLNFPYVWLPGFIVPLVLFSHLLAIKKIIKINKGN